MQAVKTPIFLHDPYFQKRFTDAKSSNKRLNAVMLIIFSLLCFGYSIAIFDWFVITIALATMAMVKAYFVVLIFRYRKTLPHKEIQQ